MLEPLPPDPYRALDLSQEAQTDAIKKRYRELILKCHPDKVPESEKAAATERFAAVQNAWEILGDTAKRRDYHNLVKKHQMAEEMKRHHASPASSAKPPATGGFYPTSAHYSHSSPVNDFPSRGGAGPTKTRYEYRSDRASYPQPDMYDEPRASPRASREHRGPSSWDEPDLRERARDRAEPRPDRDRAVPRDRERDPREEREKARDRDKKYTDKDRLQKQKAKDRQREEAEKIKKDEEKARRKEEKEKRVKEELEAQERKREEKDLRKKQREALAAAAAAAAADDERRRRRKVDEKAARREAEVKTTFVAEVQEADGEEYVELTQRSSRHKDRSSERERTKESSGRSSRSRSKKHSSPSRSPYMEEAPPLSIPASRSFDEKRLATIDYATKYMNSKGHVPSLSRAHTMRPDPDSSYGESASGGGSRYKVSGGSGRSSHRRASVDDYGEEEYGGSGGSPTNYMRVPGTQYKTRVSHIDPYHAAEAQYMYEVPLTSSWSQAQYANYEMPDRTRYSDRY